MALGFWEVIFSDTSKLCNRASNILAMLTQTGRGLKFGWRADLVLFYSLYMLILELNNNKTIIPLQKILFFKTPKKKKKKNYLVKLSLEMAIENW